MRTADTPENGSVVETTTRRRVLSPADPSVALQKPDFWDYIEALKPEDWEGPPGHTVYIYRTDPRSSNYGTGESNIDKCSGFIELRPGVNVPFNDREEVELAIREKHGGKAFRLILKRGRERITEGKVSNDAPPKFRAYSEPANGAGNSPTVTPSEDYSTAAVARDAMHMVANKEAEAINVGVNAMRGAAEVIQRLAAQSQPAPSASDDLLKQALGMMLQRALNPPPPPPAPDPIELLTRVLNLQQQLGGHPSAAAGTNPLVDKILEAGLDRVLNPLPTGPVSSAGAELVRVLPTVANAAIEGVREWRVGSEAQLQTAQIMASQGRAPALPAGAVVPPPARPSAAHPTPEAAAMDPRVKVVIAEQQIMKILTDLDYTPEEAADEVMVFLTHFDETLPLQLAGMGETGLLALFQSRQILQPAMQDMPRLQEFIKAFLKYAAENAQSADTNAPASVKPN